MTATKGILRAVSTIGVVALLYVASFGPAFAVVMHTASRENYISRCDKLASFYTPLDWVADKYWPITKALLAYKGFWSSLIPPTPGMTFAVPLPMPAHSK